MSTSPTTPSADCSNATYGMQFEDNSSNQQQQQQQGSPAQQDETSTACCDAAMLLEFERLIGPPKKVNNDEYNKLQQYKLGSHNDAYVTYTLDDLNEDLRFYSNFSIQGHSRAK